MYAYELICGPCLVYYARSVLEGCCRDAEEKKALPEVYLKQVVSALAIYSESKKVHDREGMYSFLRVAEKSSFGKLKPVLDGGEKIVLGS
jgi:hypothetical protein